MKRISIPSSANPRFPGGGKSVPLPLSATEGRFVYPVTWTSLLPVRCPIRALDYSPRLRQGLSAPVGSCRVCAVTSRSLARPKRGSDPCVPIARSGWCEDGYRGPAVPSWPAHVATRSARHGRPGLAAGALQDTARGLYRCPSHATARLLRLRGTQGLKAQVSSRPPSMRPAPPWRATPPGARADARRGGLRAAIEEEVRITTTGIDSPCRCGTGEGAPEATRADMAGIVVPDGCDGEQNSREGERGR